MNKELTKDELIGLMHEIMNPVALTTKQVDKKLCQFVLGCPDPSAALGLVTDDLTPMTPEQLVERALAHPRRAIKDVPFTEVGEDHWLRKL